MPRTSERGGPATRERIARTAARLFLERGFDAVTVAEVAREAGVSSVTVFKHFPRKEDLFLDRSQEAADVLRDAVRSTPPDGDVLSSLHDALIALLERRDPLSGTDAASLPFFRTVAASPALTARALGIEADLERGLAEELAGRMDADDARLLAAFLVGGYATVLLGTAQRRLEGDADVAGDHRRRLDRLFAVLREGVPAAQPTRGPSRAGSVPS